MAASEAPTRRRILDAAFDLFHAQGVPATSVEQILAASETGKSQLYHYFGSKEGLVLAVVEDFEAKLEDGLLPGQQELRTLDDLAGWFGAFVEHQRQTGCVRHCPMATIAAGLDEEQDPIREVIARVFRKSRAGLERFFAERVRAGELPADVDVEALVDFCYVIMQGGLVVSRVQHDPAPFERAVAQAMAHVRALAARVS